MFYNNRMRVILSALIVLFCVSACGTVSVVKMKEAINEAEGYRNEVKRLQGDKIYPEEFDQAEKKYQTAIEYSKKGDRGKAYSNTSDSIESFTAILKKLLFGPMRQEALRIKADIDSKGPDTSLRDLLPKLDRILEYADAVERGQQIISLNPFTDIREEFEKIVVAYKNKTELKLESDVSFKIGSQELSGEAKKILRNFADEIISAMKKEIEGRSKAIIKITTIAYTDEVPFSDDSKIFKYLKKEIKSIPKRELEKRKYLNRRLSEFRSEAVAKFLEESLSEYKDNDVNIRFESKFIGRGEEMPPNISSPYHKDDRRRRICIIESYCIFE